MIKLTLNQQAFSVKEGSDLLALLQSRLGPELVPFCAVAVNRRFVPRERYQQIILEEGDAVDLVLPMQGG